MAYEKTFVLLKPDAVQRGLVGTIIDIFRDNDLMIVAQMTKKPDSDFIMAHLDYDPHYTQAIGRKVLKLYEMKNMDRSLTAFADKEEMDIGLILKQWMSDYLTSGDNVAFILEGDDAIARTKALCGATFPTDADKNSIRGRFGSDSFEICIQEKRAPYNIMHAADSEKEAAHQIKKWFPVLELAH